ncbi:hypothetical protein CN553_30205 [Bacillus cereus]|uniref:Uncharacterized protein n=2 Tax=Bacillus cereus group TaxID=86661 RepID=A0ABD6R560_BACTU|nr:hypothetical protein C2I25_22090 [Bacillus cereus]OPD48578.1 hypothetical protein BVF97_21830 [Bacillus thuringiensis]OTY08459.1 hypothetical protein BK734_16250 [Bacillus thuringiensis serovar kim]PAW40424.1 hypothetical protein CKQ70_12160 [Bacillus toyonensis]PAW46907.1 hypothetical protein CKQ69_08135 [Bacillus toyonensis]
MYLKIINNRGSKLFETLIIFYYKLSLIAKQILENSKYSLQKTTVYRIEYKQNRSPKKDFYFVTYNE